MTDVGDEMSWRQPWDVGDQYYEKATNKMILPPIFHLKNLNFEIEMNYDSLVNRG